MWSNGFTNWSTGTYATTASPRADPSALSNGPLVRCIKYSRMSPGASSVDTRSKLDREGRNGGKPSSLCRASFQFSSSWSICSDPYCVREDRKKRTASGFKKAHSIKPVGFSICSTTLSKSSSEKCTYAEADQSFFKPRASTYPSS